MKSNCRNCGYEVVSWDAVKAAIQKDYDFTNDELDEGKIAVRVYHPDCAIADGRIDDESECDGLSFYWEAYRVS